MIGACHVVMAASALGVLRLAGQAFGAWVGVGDALVNDDGRPSGAAGRRVMSPQG